MRQKNTHTKGLFSALKRRAEISVSVVLSLLIFAGPVEASTWKPTALVNTEAFHSIDDTDTAANVVLKFGDTLAKTLTYDRISTRFEFNDDIYVIGNAGVSGTLSGAFIHAEKTLSTSGALAVESGAFIGGDLRFGNSVSHFLTVQETSAATGKNLTVGAGDAATLGGALILQGGANADNRSKITIGGSGDDSGNIDIDAGDSGAGSAGGNITISAGDGMVTGAGTVEISGGSNSFFGDGGSVYLHGGAKVTNYNDGNTLLAITPGGTPLGNVGIRTLDPSTELEVAGTMSGTVVYAKNSLRSSGSLVFEGSASGSSLYLGTSLAGAGLSSCSDGTTSKLLYNSATGRFSCGTDQTGGGFGTGNVLTIGNQKYVSKQGDTMTGALAVNIQGGTLGSIGINAVNTISGAIIHAEKNLTSSGGILTFGDIISKAILKTSSYGLAFASGAVLNEWSGFNSMINIQNGGLGTNGITRLSKQGNLTNIGSIQSGEIHATAGSIFSQTDRTDYTTGSSPRRALIRDVNGDGKQDILVSNSTTTTFSAFINNGNGTFAAKVDYTTGSNPYSIATADFNGDGKLDVVAGDNGAATVSVLLNKGDGTFLTRTAYSAGSVVHDVATGDINGDGKPDIVSANYNADSVSVFINNGAGRFAAKADFTTSDNPTGVAVADFNGDGKMDIATTNLIGGNISVLINTGNGTFATKVDYVTGSSPFAIAIGDLNDDGETDIATANFGGTNASVFLNNGNGTFATKVDYSAGSTPRGIGIGDINGDGKLDIAVSNGGAGTVSVLQNRGNGIFATKVDYTVGSGPYSVALGDVNGDGKADIVTANLSDTDTSVIFNTAKTILYASSGTGGTVGIGTATPGSKLSVSGAVLINNKGNIGNTSADAGLALEVVGTISGSLLRAGNMTVSGAIVYTSGSTLMQTAKGFSGQILVGRGTGTPEWKSPTGSMVWYLGGDIAVGGTQGPQVYMPFGFRPTSVNMIATGAPTGADLIVDLKQNGASIFGTKPQINAGSTTGGGSATITASIINEATIMTLDVTQVGSTFAGSGLTVLLNGSRRY